MTQRNRFFMVLLIGTYLGVEIVLHMAFGVLAVAQPIWMKMRYGATITVPIFENGIIVGSEPALSVADKQNIIQRVRRAAKLFAVGFKGDLFNAGYAKLRAYRNGLKVYTANPYIPYVREQGVRRLYTSDDKKEMSVISDVNGFLVIEAPSGDLPSRTIMTLGASTTDSPYPFYLWRYLNKARLPLRFRVVNAALPSYVTADNIATFAFRGADYLPDIVVFYEANNDMFPSYSSQFKTDYSHWRTTFDDAVMHRFGFLDRLPRWLDRSALYSLLRQTLLSSAIERFNWGIWGPTTRYAPALTDEKEFHGLNTYKRNLISLLGLVGAHGGQMLFVTQAHQRKFGTPASYAEAERMNIVMADVARAHADTAWFFDFAKEVAPRIDELMVRDDVHFDEPGYQVLGEAIGREIAARWRRR